MISIVLSEEADIPALQAMEQAANQQFIAWGHPEAAGFDSIPTEIAMQAIAEQRIWSVWLDANPSKSAEPVGWLLMMRLGAELCVGEITVDPRVQQQGIGTRVLTHFINQATSNGEPSIVLNTQTDVPWNKPWYETLGFVSVPESDWTPEMREVTAGQRAAGLDWSTRTHMRLVLG